MSDQPEPTNNVKAVPAALRDTRWLAGVIWGAILIALLVSSWAGVAGGGLGAGAFTFFPFLALGADDLNPDDNDPELIATFALIITVAIAAVLIFAWWRFATATRQLLQALSDVSDHPNADPAPSYWLPLSNGGRSELVDLVPALGMAWALIIIRPVAVLALQVYSST